MFNCRILTTACNNQCFSSCKLKASSTLFSSLHLPYVTRMFTAAFWGSSWTVAFWRLLFVRFSDHPLSVLACCWHTSHSLRVGTPWFLPSPLPSSVHTPWSSAHSPSLHVRRCCRAAGHFPGLSATTSCAVQPKLKLATFLRNPSGLKEVWWIAE